ncbi:ABC transporter substrate-binding protein [Actinokineospora iranica]|uniref:Iron complex transport system substrate-binding protein n=1 Tax=Actinokineospora iranica TaxID=1271860 RepID=A0A1G6LE72_9PSEU|nr:ABC transporter substrate-binding protein [Actinokineospora iranica]SDC41075.1 iron complex transport system substrate-binding protein [Actinokineospora iranica]
MISPTSPTSPTLPHRTRTRAALLASTALLLAACGAQVQPSAAPGASTPAEATVTNCGAQVTYPVPQRPVAYDVSGVEKMFSLGLADRMRGYVMNSLGDPSIAGSPWKDDYAKVERLGTKRVTREILVDAKADWVIAGWNSGFSEERGITPTLLEQVGIRSYLHTETCWDYPKSQADVTPMEALYTDLTNLGQIFGVQKRAEELVAELRGRMDTVRAGAPKDKPPVRVFVYDSGTDQAFTAGRHAAPNDVIAAAGGANVFATLEDGWGAVGWEAVVKTEPEVIIVVDYADQPAADKIAFLKAHPALASSPAVRDNRFHVISYGDMVSGPRNVQGAESLAAYLRSIGR